jgi:CheY-like chemotaxis protein
MLSIRVWTRKIFWTPMPILSTPAPQAASSSLDVLVVDDDEPSRELMRAMLASLGYRQVRITSNGIEALAEVYRRAPDCILMDLIMPEMDGLMVTTRIREFEAACESEAYIAAITAHFAVGIHETCAAAGMNGYLMKPFRREEIERVLNSAIARRAALAA